MIVIKGSHVRFELVSQIPAEKRKKPPATNGKVISLPNAYGIIHDPDSENFDKCECYFGPYKRTRKRIEMTQKASAYMGSSYPATFATVDLPSGTWKPIGDVAQIFYKRPGRYSGKYFHPFKAGFVPKLYKNGRFYKLALPGGCIVDDRGFVFP